MGDCVDSSGCALFLWPPSRERPVQEFSFRTAPAPAPAPAPSQHSTRAAPPGRYVIRCRRRPFERRSASRLASRDRYHALRAAICCLLRPPQVPVSHGRRARWAWGADCAMLRAEGAGRWALGAGRGAALRHRCCGLASTQSLGRAFCEQIARCCSLSPAVSTRLLLQEQELSSDSHSNTAGLSQHNRAARCGLSGLRTGPFARIITSAAERRSVIGTVLGSCAGIEGANPLDLRFFLGAGLGIADV
jgi:hypothetical protein